MALRSRDEVSLVIENIRNGTVSPVYLCYGERYLCQQSAARIEQAFLESGKSTIHVVDGTSEETGKTLSRLQSFSLLPGRQIYRINDTRIFLSRAAGSELWERAVKARQDNKLDVASRHLANLLALAYQEEQEPDAFSSLSAAQWRDTFGFDHPGNDLSWADEAVAGRQPAKQTFGQDAAEKLVAGIDKGFPPGTILLLLSEHIDKRKRLFTCIKDKGEIIDCSVAEGSSRAAQEAQKQIVREMAMSTLEEFGKTIDSRVLDLVFERIGFHPVAVVREMEKLALFVDDRRQITKEDIEQLVGRTREDALFELTEALASRFMAKSLIVLHHLLNDGIHDLAIIATLRNFIRRLLIIRSIQQQRQPTFHPSMVAAEFQNRYLPELKASGAWPELLKGHPYALFMSFKKAAEWSIPALKTCLGHLVEAEYRLKGTPLPSRLILEELLVSLIAAGTIRSAAGSY